MRTGDQERDATRRAAGAVELQVALRSRDFDQLGHVNQAVYHELLEEARIAFFRAAVPDGLLFVLARVELEHRGEVSRGHDAVAVSTRLERIGRSSVEVSHELRVPGGPLAAEGRSVLVAWDPAARGSRPFTDAERAALRATAGGAAL
jgi:acyl-CoA thioester hydrolase